MPEYMYRREDGSTFTIRQKFSDDALTVDPDTGQKVVRVVQATGIIFKGSGFYVNDSKGASKTNLASPSSTENDTGKSETKSETSSDAKPAATESKAKPKADSKTDSKAS